MTPSTIQQSHKGEVYAQNMTRRATKRKKQHPRTCSSNIGASRSEKRTDRHTVAHFSYTCYMRKQNRMRLCVVVCLVLEGGKECMYVRYYDSFVGSIEAVVLEITSVCGLACCQADVCRLDVIHTRCSSAYALNGYRKFTSSVSTNATVPCVLPSVRRPSSHPLQRRH